MTQLPLRPAIFTACSRSVKSFVASVRPSQEVDPSGRIFVSQRMAGAAAPIHRAGLHRRPHPTLAGRSVGTATSQELMMRDSDLFMLVPAMTCGPELAPESCFVSETRVKLLNPA